MMTRKLSSFFTIAICCGAFFVQTGGGSAAFADDQPQWGQAWSRNLVYQENGLPSQFNPETGLNIKWSARLGSESHATPVVANGRVYIGTNNDEPRDPRHQGDRGVLMCFDEENGSFLWQLVVPKRSEDKFFDWPKSGIASPVTVEGKQLYVVSNRGEVMCLDVEGMSDGNDGPYQDEGAHMVLKGMVPFKPRPHDADILWIFDLVSGAGIWSHDAAHSSILIRGNQLYLNSGTGVDNTHRVIRRPEAPNLVVLDKQTGTYLARDGVNIGHRNFHCTWSAPSMGRTGGRDLVVFAGGDGIIYAFEPWKGEAKGGDPGELELVWKFDPDPTAPKVDVHRYWQNRREGPSNVYGMPVFFQGKVYVAGGGDLFWGKKEAWMKCIDASGTGDITQSGEIWSYPLVNHTVTTPAIWNGMVFATDIGRTVHCVDAETGEPYWTHRAEGEFWASPMVSDGKVYVGTRGGDFWVFEAVREKRVLSKVQLNSPVSATAVAANGVLYVATMTHLYAVEQKGEEKVGE